MATGPRVVVREAALDDAPAIARIQVRSWRAAYRGLMPDAVLDGLSAAEREERWTEILGGEGAGAFTLVAQLGDAVVGFCSIVLPSRDPDADAATGEVAALYVDPAHWGGGAGRVLLDAALARVPPERFTHVTLWVLAGNARARRFYAAAGFRTDGAEASHAASGAREVRLRAALPRGEAGRGVAVDARG